MQITWRMTPNHKSETVFLALKEIEKDTPCDTDVSKIDWNFLTSLRVIKLKSPAIDGIYHDGLVHAAKAIIPISMSFFHNVWAFPIWRKFGRSCYIPSHIIGCSKYELAFHKDSFMHILLIHVAHSLLVS